jgi:hypothetical protein
LKTKISQKWFLIRKFPSSEKSEPLLSNVANLMESFEERQSSVTATLTHFLEGILPPCCRSLEVQAPLTSVGGGLFFLDLQNKKKKSEEMLEVRKTYGQAIEKEVP